MTKRQLERAGMVALLEKSKPGYHCGYEVVIVQSHDGFEIAGRYIEAGESMPPTSQWGSKGWTFLPSDKAGALRKLWQLQSDQDARLAVV